MPSIVLDHISFHYDSPYAQVFERLSVSIDTDWRTGVVGRNGRGKTTLLRLIQKQLQPVKGKINVPLRTHYFPYRTRNIHQITLHVMEDCVAPFRRWENKMSRLLGKDDEASMAEYAEILEKYERFGGYDIDARIEKEMAEMGMDGGLLRQSFDTLSGGEQTRTLILALFLRKDSFPLIDEPTNHLDMKGRKVLGEYLAKKQGFLLVSHDRFLLDKCTDHILSINRDDVRINQGSFSEWKYQMDLEEESEKRRDENLKREIRSLEKSARQRRGWSDLKEKEKSGAYDKGFVGHMAAKQMKRALSIEQRIEEKIAEKKRLLRNVERKRKLKLTKEKKSPETVLAIENVTVEIEGKTIIKDFSLSVSRGDRVAVLGSNGSGKTTLLRAISGEIALSEGRIVLPRYLKVERAYQDPLWDNGYLREHLRSCGLEEASFRGAMGAFGVSGEIFERPLETFSHGELKKVDLCRSFLYPTHLLLWDEPMNYIDLMSREQIEKAVLRSNPTMLFVDHDRWFVDNIATDIVELV
jgi:lincosamide and streptogramin A transport system ATP-binding/permease protein